MAFLEQDYHRFLRMTSQERMFQLAVMTLDEGILPQRKQMIDLRNEKDGWYWRGDFTVGTGDARRSLGTQFIYRDEVKNVETPVVLLSPQEGDLSDRDYVTRILMERRLKLHNAMVVLMHEPFLTDIDLGIQGYPSHCYHVSYSYTPPTEKRQARHDMDVIYLGETSSMTTWTEAEL